MTLKIPLSELLDTISSELIAADERARRAGRPTMTFEECELEFSFSMEDEGKAGVKLYIFDVGANKKLNNSNKAKLKFKAHPTNTMQAPQMAVGDAPPVQRNPRASR